MKSDLKKDFKKISMIDYNKINIVDNVDRMIKSAFQSQSKILEKRINLVLETVLTPEDYTRVKQLEKKRQNDILKVFLKEKGIAISAIQKNSTHQVEENTPDIYDVFITVLNSNRANKTKQYDVKVSHFSEEDFRKDFEELKKYIE